MVTVTTEIRGQHTSTETYKVTDPRVAFENTILREDPFQVPSNGVGFYMTKHIGWMLGREECGTPLSHPAVDFDQWLHDALERVFFDETLPSKQLPYQPY